MPTPDELETTWEEAKAKYPIGHRFQGKVVNAEHYGIFLDLGFPIVDGYKLSGLIDIVTFPDEDSLGLPAPRFSTTPWPVVGAMLSCKVVGHRDQQMEVACALLSGDGVLAAWEAVKLHYPPGRRFGGKVVRTDDTFAYIELGQPIIDGYRLGGMLRHAPFGENGNDQRDLKRAGATPASTVGSLVVCEVEEHADSLMAVRLRAVEE
jgi:hypothetical protein